MECSQSKEGRLSLLKKATEDKPGVHVVMELLLLVFCLKEGLFFLEIHSLMEEKTPNVKHSFTCFI